jgi:polyferredoxin
MQQERSYLRILRYAVQLAFVLIALFIGYQFYHFVLHFEEPGHPFVERPASVDSFMPIGGLMAFKLFLLTGTVDPVHPSGFVMFVAILGVSFAFRKGFCGWICPIGTLSQWFWMAGEKVFGRNFRIPKFGDISLRSLKYVLMGLFLLAIGIMPLWSMAMFIFGDYYKIVDVRMLKFFTEMTTLTMWVLIALVGFSLLYKNFWCRYLCPYGALLGILSRFSPFKIKRSEEKCSHCRACTNHCPALIDVEKTKIVTSEECLGCLTCLSRCPVGGAIDLTVGSKTKHTAVRPLLFPVFIVALFYLVIVIGMVNGTWHSQIPYAEYQKLIPEVNKEYVGR